MSTPSPGESGNNAPDVLQQTWQALTAGQIVGLPTETGYVLAAHLSHPEAIERLCKLGQRTGTVPCLAVRGANEVQELLPALSNLGLRMCRRFWPGPLLVQIPDAPALLEDRLPASVVESLVPDGILRMRLPASDLLLHLLPVLGGPVVLLPIPEPAADAPDDQRTGAARMLAYNLEPDLLAEMGPHPALPACSTVEVRGEQWELLVSGAVPREAIEKSLGCVVVFVCTGNTCRSPLAEAICKKLLADRLGCEAGELNAHGYHVFSAGLSAMPGHPAAPEAIAVASEYGAELSLHRSRPLSEGLAATADYLLAMTHSHLYGLDDGYPHLGSTPRLVRIDGTDIADPIGQSHAVYQECARQIRESLETWLDEFLPRREEPT